ncbi:putative transporter MCH2 [Pseudocercospora fuligena]|uniref:Putative transporter MCH2 n=1 Tax=Pseudocercospora fuligena TaxID=685502 RepID=A0A8H6RGT2_9PEZI|nr:putative transporter MCH2 [Pseudocercospora fuligena]
MSASSHQDEEKDIDFIASPQQQQESDNSKQSEASPPRNSAPPPPPPDGGYGWVCTVCCATINAHTWGLNSSYGVFLAHYLQNNTFPGASYLEYAFVGSLSISCAMLISPVATLSTRYFGTKVSLGIGILLETASLIGASFASKIWQLFLSQGICFGFGMGFLFVASVGIPAQWFTTRRSLANGISACGSGFGGLVYSLAAGAMLKSLGLAWTFRVLGILAFGVNTICAILLRDRNKIIGSSQNAFDVQLFKRVEYLLLGGYGWFSMLGYVVLIFSLANYANAIGLNASQASVVSAILNLGQGLGRPPIGYFSDNIGRINMAAMMTGLCALLSFAIWIPAQSYGVLLFFAIVGGAVAGTFWATIAPVAAEVVGLKYVPSALNLEWLIIVLPCTFSEPIALEIVGGTGSYLGAQLFVAFMYIAAAMCLVFLRGWKIGEVDAIAKMNGESADMVDAVAAENDEALADQARIAGRQRIMVDFWKWRRV